MRSLQIFIGLLFLSLATAAQGHGIVNNSKSPHVTFRSIDIGDCQWTEGFWADKKEGMYRKVTKPEFETFPIQFVPYYSWNNRGIGEMTVFVPVIWGSSKR